MGRHTVKAVREVKTPNVPHHGILRAVLDSWSPDDIAGLVCYLGRLVAGTDEARERGSALTNGTGP
jgi:hypothetical protein